MSSPPASPSPGPAAGSLPSQWVNLLYQVTRQFASSLELDEVLGQVLGLTVQAVQASEGSIFVLDPQGRVNRSILARGDLAPQVRVPTVDAVMSKGFAGWVVQRRQAGLIADTAEDSRWHAFPDDRLETRSALAAPLIRRDRVIGVLTLTHPEPHHFIPEQLELLEAIAAQAATAIENASLFMRVNTERAVLEAIIAGVEDIILVTDLGDRLILANPAAQQSLALDEAALGQPLSQIVNEPELLEFFRTGGGSGVTRKVALRNSRVFDCALVDVPEVGRVLGMHDVTPFETLNTMKSEFVSHVAHDLKSPLAVIMGYAWMLTESPTIEPEERSYAQRILNSISKMKELIDNILDIGRIEMGIEAEFARTDLAAVVRNATNSLQSLADKRQVSLETTVTEGLPAVHGAQLRLEQAVSNLVGNALKFTPAGGSVKVWAGVEKGELVVRVTDTGPGIPHWEQARLFQKFSRLRREETRAQEGHGLGLAIVRSVVEAHRGRAWVESQAGQGSTFAFALPPYEAEEDSESGRGEYG
jgi:two-component system phosphate regulon sensor histidine kinase PhoR